MRQTPCTWPNLPTRTLRSSGLCGVRSNAHRQQALLRCVQRRLPHTVTVDALLSPSASCPLPLRICSHIAAVIGLADVVYSREIGVDIVLGYVRFWTGSGGAHTYGSLACHSTVAVPSYTHGIQAAAALAVPVTACAGPAPYMQTLTLQTRRSTQTACFC